MPFWWNLRLAQSMMLIIMALMVFGCSDQPLDSQADGDREEEIQEGWETDSDVEPDKPSLTLNDWKLAPAMDAGADGETLSQVGFDDRSWTEAHVPGTVMGARTDAGELGDLLYGDNLKNTPGWALSFLPMPADSPYRDSWWWRTEFSSPPLTTGGHAWLVFEGVNYRANIWLNGRRIASQDEVVGTFRAFRFDVTESIIPEKKNALAVETFAPDLWKDLAIFWVDWNPTPPDRNMGLWMPVRLMTGGPVSLDNPAVSSRLHEDGSAELTLVVELTNLERVSKETVLSGVIDGHLFTYSLTLKAAEKREVKLTSDQVPILRMISPRLWWPYQYGEPYLYSASLKVSVDGNQSDAAECLFGVREVKAEFTADGALLYSINGRPILIRGAGYAPDMLYRDDPERDRAEIAYVKDMGLNTIRLEGKMKTHDFYDLCDREGVLVMPGWCCCDLWEQWDDWTDDHFHLAQMSLENQLRRLRRHPSVFTWLNGSDFHPTPEVEQMYVDVANAAGWNLPIVSSASETPSEVTGPSGFKMTGPYNWVPPNYWYLAVPTDPQSLLGTADWPWMYGGAFGFNSESSPGPSVPPIESLRRMMPEADIWPIDQIFLFHSGGVSTAFSRMDIYQTALSERLGEPSNAEDFAFKSQVMNYEAHRAMFEAQGRNKYFATGHIQWMLNNAWPGTIWQLYDYYLRPGGCYFGCKEALRPLHIQYSYDDKSVWVVNSTLQDAVGLRAEAALYDMNSARVATRSNQIDLPADGNVEVLSLADEIADLMEVLAPVYFLDLKLIDSNGKVLDRNFYWLAMEDDSFDLISTEDNLPFVHHADMTELSSLPLVRLQRSNLDAREVADGVEFTLSVTNPTSKIAFFVELALIDTNTGEPILPVKWSENYISLLPGETRSFTAWLNTGSFSGMNPEVIVKGWNVPEENPNVP